MSLRLSIGLIVCFGCFAMHDDSSQHSAASTISRTRKIVRWMNKKRVPFSLKIVMVKAAVALYDRAHNYRSES